MKFYASILSGKITKMQTFKDAPIEAPQSANTRVYDSTLQADQLSIKASDSFPGQESRKGSNISLFLNFSDEDEQKMVYNKLSEEGEIQFELNTSTGFAMVEDKFGIFWMLAYHSSHQTSQ